MPLAAVGGGAKNPPLGRAPLPPRAAADASLASSLQRLGGWRLGARLGGDIIGASERTPPSPVLPGSDMLRLKESFSDSLDRSDSLNITKSLCVASNVCVVCVSVCVYLCVCVSAAAGRLARLLLLLAADSGVVVARGGGWGGTDVTCL